MSHIQTNTMHNATRATMAEENNSQIVELNVLAVFTNFSSKNMPSTQVTRAHYHLVLKSTHSKSENGVCQLQCTSFIGVTSGKYTPTHHHSCFTALFPGPPGWAGARRELLDFMVQGKINRGRHTDHPAGCHSNRTNQCLPPPPPFFTGRMPFLPPNQQCQSTEGN